MIERELVVHYPLGSSTRRKKRVILLAGLVGALASALLLFVGARAYESRFCVDSKVELTRMAVKEYADVAFLRWVMNHPDRSCPDGLADLNQYTNRMGADINDAWGRPMLMDCRSGPLRVWSLGEDGVPNTTDDIYSWDPYWD